MKLPEKTTFKEWMKYAVLTDFQLGVYDRPNKVGKHDVPQDLNGLTLGQLFQLSLTGEGNPFFHIPSVLLGMTEKEVLKAKATEVVGFCGWVVGRVREINELFDNIHKGEKHSAQEIKAGIEKLTFGAFGMIDWYALRMGIQHKEVEDTPWLIVYQCMKNDHEKEQYKRRYHEIIEDEYKRKSRSHRK